MNIIRNRYEFVYLFDVINGNPNGDPDAGNLPRIDPETGHGLVTDVCLKRKIRNYIALAKQDCDGYNIYITEKAVLNEINKKAYNSLEIEPKSKKLPKEAAEAKEVTAWMCENYFDIRSFGAVMTTEVNCGQVRGPVQLAFSSSVDPIIPAEISITRMAVTNERDRDKERTMGRKSIVPYGLYRAHGYISAKLAEQTGFSESDLELLWESLKNMLEHDHSAARGEMSARKLIIFKHENAMGNAPAHKLFDLVRVEKKSELDTPPRKFEDYKINIAQDKVPKGIELRELL